MPSPLWARSIPLSDSIRAAGTYFREGSLRVSFLGDNETVQGWVILSSEGKLLELPMQPATDLEGGDLVAFWDASHILHVKPVFYLVNAGASPLTVTLAGEGLRRREDTPKRQVRKTLSVGEQLRVRPTKARGWIRVSHDGQPGALQGVGLLDGPEHPSVLPFFRSKVAESTTAFEAIRIPLGGDQDGQRTGSVLTLFNTSGENRQVTIDILDPTIGASMGSASEWLKPAQVVSLKLNRIIGQIPSSVQGPDLRASIKADSTGVLVTGTSTLASGEVLDLSFFPAQKAHATGMYPILPLNTHEPFATLVNLSDEDSVVVAHFSWSSGTYAYGPILIPARSSRRLDVAEIAGRQEPDMLGRTLDPKYEAGFLRWRVQSGSQELIARTEARLRGGKDVIGFNCFGGCCPELPYGTVVPECVSFVPGEVPLFQSCVTYSTCTGTEGPWPTLPSSMSVPAPFSWDGIRVSATDAAQEDLHFDGLENGIDLSCEWVNFSISAQGKADTCKLLLRKAHKPTESWDLKEACSSQVGGEPNNKKCARCQSCCHAILAWQICTKTGILHANTTHQTCLTTCGTDVCG